MPLRRSVGLASGALGLGSAEGGGCRMDDAAPVAHASGRCTSRVATVERVQRVGRLRPELRGPRETSALR
jgi:hypothetical protein